MTYIDHLVEHFIGLASGEGDSGLFVVVLVGVVNSKKRCLLMQLVFKKPLKRKECNAEGSKKGKLKCKAEKRRGGKRRGKRER